MIEFVPAILAATKEEFNNQRDKICTNNSFEGGWIHIDFMDNVFVQNQSIDPDQIIDIPADFKKEAHLMVEHPLGWIDKLLEVGFKRVIFHLESKDDINQSLEYAKNKGLEVGLAIKSETPVEKLVEFMSKIDLVLVMSVEPGFQGQPFIPESLEKVKDLVNVRDKNGYSYKIGVDGHINDENIKSIVDTGVDHIIVGSYFTKGENIDENLEKIWEAVNS